MALFFVTMMILSCVSVGERTKPTRYPDIYADISVSLMEAVNSNSAFNMSGHVKGIFGTASLTGPVEGQLVHVHSEKGYNRTGCKNYTHGVPTNNWVALIERGKCKFPVKVNIATKGYNATAVIVYDNKLPKNLVKMKIFEEKEVYVFVNQPDGKRLAQLVDSGLDVHIKITAAASCSPSPYSLVACPILSSTVATLGLYLAFGQSV